MAFGTENIDFTDARVFDVQPISAEFAGVQGNAHTDQNHARLTGLSKEAVNVARSALGAIASAQNARSKALGTIEFSRSINGSSAAKQAWGAAAEASRAGLVPEAEMIRRAITGRTPGARSNRTGKPFQPAHQNFGDLTFNA